MAYTVGKALTYAKKFIKDQPIDGTDVGVQTLDMASKFFWMYAPWRWTIGNMSPVQITGNAVDYTVAEPADFLYLQQAWLPEGDKFTPLDIVPMLPADPKQTGKPSKVMFVQGATDKYRLFPQPPAGGDKWLLAIYKKAHTEITATSDTPGFPDEWFPIYQEIVLYYAYKFADDQRAGSSTIMANGQTQHSGQWGKVISMLEAMKGREDLLFTWPGSMQSKEQR
jgi:hypothetical protein